MRIFLTVNLGMIPARNLVIAGGGNAGAGVEAVLTSGAEAAEALVPGLLSRAKREPAAGEVVPA
jgi:all-trans-retinol 13,14-reductase